MKLQAFLKEKLGNALSGKQIKHAIDSNLCKINGKTERFASTTVGKGDTITFEEVRLPKQDPIHFEHSRVLYEDDDFLIYDKPPFIASDNPKFLTALQRGLPFLSLAHRLDKETTGILIFAKQELALSAILELFKNRLINKTYLALVDGVPQKSSGRIDNYLGERKHFEGQTIWGSVPKSKGLHAITDWECEKSGKDVALLKCFPKTGRTHQIRVHLSEMGFPILGDFQYNRQFKCAFRPARYLLHASEVQFRHPKTGKEVTVVAPIPQDFADAMEKLHL